jgi:hypothetical protein
VGKLLNEHFATGFQQVGMFKVVGRIKKGGNVASYFCTADGGVLHAIAGPVDAATLLREAAWVLETHAKAKKAGKEGGADYVKVVRRAHADRLEQESKPSPATQLDVHRLLANHAQDNLEDVYVKVWEGILKEKVTHSIKGFFRDK